MIKMKSKKMVKKKKKKRQAVSETPVTATGIIEKGMETMKHNINLHLHKFKQDPEYKTKPEVKYKLIYLLDKLKNEEKVSKKVTHVVDTKWRDAMRKSKVSSLKVEFINHVEFQNIELNCQQNRIIKLDNELNECNQVSFEFKTKFIENLKQLLGAFESSYTKQVEMVKSQFDDEISNLSEVNSQRIYEIQCYIDTIEAAYLNELKDLDANFKQLKDEQTTNHRNEMISLKLHYEKQASAIQSTLRTLVDDYEKDQKQSLNKYIELSSVIKQAEDVLTRDKLYYENLVNKYTNLKGQCDGHHADVLSLKIENLKELKEKKEKKVSQLDECKTKIYQNLKKLSKFTHETLEALESKQTKAEKILKLIKKCSQLEFIDRYSHLYKNYENLSCAPFVDLFTEHGYLVNIYKKYNFVQLHAQSLTIERKKLLDENTFLRTKLKEYFNTL